MGGLVRYWHRWHRPKWISELGRYSWGHTIGLDLGEVWRFVTWAYGAPRTYAVVYASTIDPGDEWGRTLLADSEFTTALDGWVRRRMIEHYEVAERGAELGRQLGLLPQRSG
jgi:hypothetical protein